MAEEEICTTTAYRERSQANEFINQWLMPGWHERHDTGSADQLDLVLDAWLYIGSFQHSYSIGSAEQVRSVGLNVSAARPYHFPRGSFLVYRPEQKAAVALAWNRFYEEFRHDR